MPGKKKKSRKVGLIGVRKDPDYKHKKSPSTTKSNKKPKGKPAGSRHNVESTAKETSAVLTNKDPRHGSKKPVQLVKTIQPQQIKKFATPAEELAAIEADDRLSGLLDKIDNKKPLTKEQQAYVEEKMARHQVLCNLMGIDDSEDKEDDSDDPFAKLDAIKLDDFEK